ncbi:MAG: hypothetical protein ACRD96_07370, partial [Bryobacteraceae bacterium]
MEQLKSAWRKLFDVRRGEGGRAFAMAAYLLCVLFAHYILKPVSRAIFLAEFKIDNLPYLYILLAVVGGFLATAYSKVSIQVSLKAAVTWTTGIAVGTLVLFWWILPLTGKFPPMLYFFNIWASFFGVVTVAQAWLIAANVFNPREAKRVYGLVGLGAVTGAWFGSAFTAFTVRIVGTTNLVLVAAVLVALAYVAFLIVDRQQGVSLAGAKGGEAEEAHFSVREM